MHIHDNGTFIIQPLEEVKDTIELHHAQEALAKIQEIKGNCKYLIVHVRDGKISQEARKLFQKADPGFDKVGIIVNGPLQVLVMNFFLGINKPKMPLKLFSNEIAAFNWFFK